MRNNIFRTLSLACVLISGIQAASAANDITEGDWDDWGDNPGQPEAYFVSVPEADYSELHLRLTSADKDAKILWTVSPSLQPENENDWSVYSEPLYLTEDCTVRYFAILGDSIRSEVKAFTFTYSEHQTVLPEIIGTEDSHIVMSCSTPGAEIRYTTDGTEPTEESSLYTDPIEAVPGMVITARAFAYGLFDSEITEYEVPIFTGVAAMSMRDVRISVEGGQLTVYSCKALRLPIHSLDGNLIRVIEVNDGHTIAEGLQNGVYIILGRKVKI